MKAKGRRAGQLAVFFVTFVAVKLFMAWIGIGEFEGWTDPVVTGLLAGGIWLLVEGAWNRIAGSDPGGTRGRRGG